MIALELDRQASDPNSTLGVLRTPIGAFATCEDEPRENKIPEETRIPAGTYRLGLRMPADSGMATDYKKRWVWHLGMIEILDVPGFTDIYLHIGNTERDTAGCPLVAWRAYFDAMTISVSTQAYKALARWLIPILHRGEVASITIRDLDVWAWRLSGGKGDKSG